MSRINVADVEPVVASLKAMNDRYPTSGKNGTKVGPIIRNGSHWSCVGEDHDDFGIVKQASIGTSKMDHGMESNDGQKMEREWNQVFEMLERAEVSDFVVKYNLTFGRAPSGPLAGSTATPNLTNYTGSVRSALSKSSFKNNTKSYYRPSESCESESWNYDTKFKDKIRNETKDCQSEMEKSRAWESSSRCNNNALLCSRSLKNNTQSYNSSLQSCKVKEQSYVNGSKIMISQKSKLSIQKWKSIELRSRASGLITALRAYVRLKTTSNHFISRIVL